MRICVFCGTCWWTKANVKSLQNLNRFFSPCWKRNVTFGWLIYKKHSRMEKIFKLNIMNVFLLKWNSFVKWILTQMAGCYRAMCIYCLFCYSTEKKGFKCLKEIFSNRRFMAKQKQILDLLIKFPLHKFLFCKATHTMWVQFSVKNCRLRKTAFHLFFVRLIRHFHQGGK